MFVILQCKNYFITIGFRCFILKVSAEMFDKIKIMTKTDVAVGDKIIVKSCSLRDLHRQSYFT